VASRGRTPPPASPVQLITTTIATKSSSSGLFDQLRHFWPPFALTQRPSNSAIRLRFASRSRERLNLAEPKLVAERKAMYEYNNGDRVDITTCWEMTSQQVRLRGEPRCNVGEVSHASLLNNISYSFSLLLVYSRSVSASVFPSRLADYCDICGLDSARWQVGWQTQTDLCV